MSLQSWVQTLVTAQGSGSALTAASTASLLPPQAKFTLPPNFIDTPGKTFLIKAQGQISSVITTPGTARFGVKFGSTVVFDSLAILLDTVAAHTAVGWDLEILLTATVVGTSAALIGCGKFTCEDILGVAASMPKADGVAMLPWNSTPAAGSTFDSTSSQTIDLVFTQTVATGSITLNNFFVQALN
jgi:hypothetical protein